MYSWSWMPSDNPEVGVVDNMMPSGTISMFMLSETTHVTGLLGEAPVTRLSCSDSEVVLLGPPSRRLASFSVISF